MLLPSPKTIMVTEAIKNNAGLRIMTAIAITILFTSTFFHCPPPIFSFLLGTILAIIITVEWKNLFSPSSIWFWIIMPLYPVTPFCMLIALNESPVHRNLLFYLFMLVFSFDSASYIFGKLLGKHKIIPSISPGKSWEGALGGYCITTLILIMIVLKNESQISLQDLGLLSAIICLLALSGDIFESYLKRSAGIKDSGNLLPGHGGFLDRFDAVMFVSVFFFCYRNSLIAILK